MNPQAGIYILITILGGLGLWLMLPRGRTRGRATGTLLAVISLGLLMSQFGPLAGWVQGSVFGILAGVTIVSATATITTRTPVYSAIWFGMSLLGVAGLFMMNGAQFLAVATVVVYAGAILVTFLFVLMLAQPEGLATYDRMSWESLLSAFSGAILVGILTMTVATVFSSPESVKWPLEISAADRASGVLAQDHVGIIGRQLFDRYLIAVEVAGILLLTALVGAAAIVAHTKGDQRIAVEPERLDE